MHISEPCPKDRLSAGEVDPASYRRSYEQLRARTDLAVNSYENLVAPRAGDCKIPVAWRNRPLAELGGDFLDVVDTEDGVNLMVADVAGHDPGASYHTVLIKAFFAENSRTGKGGLSLMQTLNAQLLDGGRNDRMATGLFLNVNLDRMMGELVCAGHPPAVIVRKESPVPHALHADGTVLGIAEDVRFDVYRFEVTPGDRLFLYTDGILDARRFCRQAKCWEKLGLVGLKHILRRPHEESLQDVVANAWESVLDFCGREPQDDMLLAGIEIPASESSDERLPDGC